MEQTSKAQHPAPAQNPALILTLDIGTSSLRAMLFDEHAQSISGSEIQIKYTMETTPDGGVQADADTMVAHAARAIDEIVSRLGADAGRIRAVATDQLVSNVLGVDETGKAGTPVYTYADTRCVAEVKELRNRLDEKTVHQRVGTLFHTSYLPARLLWLAHREPELFRRMRWWMSLGEYIQLRWLGTRACSYSTASWTGLLNRHNLEWDRELLAAIELDPALLSPLVDATQPIGTLQGEWARRWQPLRDAVWFSSVGDGAVANIGSGCVDGTRTALTIGTSSAMRVTVPAGGTSHTWRIPDGLWSYRVDRTHELVGGALSEGGNLYRWMQETMRLEDGETIERQLAAQEPDAHGLTLLPFLSGERAPGWRADARAAILGIHLNTQPIDLLRAGLEAVAYRLDLIYELLRSVAPEAQSVIATGGALMYSPAWVQIIADVLGVPVTVSAEPEATSRGTALLALQGLGTIRSFSDLPARLGMTHEPDPDHHATYQAAVARQQKWYNSIIGQGESKPRSEESSSLQDRNDSAS